MKFTIQPSNATAKVANYPAIVVDLNNAGSTDVVTLSLEHCMNGAKMSGSCQKAAVSGLATFDDIAIDRAGKSYKLKAEVSYAHCVSNAFDVN